jgi:hypothetical protein
MHGYHPPSSVLPRFSYSLAMIGQITIICTNQVECAAATCASSIFTSSHSNGKRAVWSRCVDGYIRPRMFGESFVVEYGRVRSAMCGGSIWSVTRTPSVQIHGATTKQRTITYKNIINLQKQHHAAKFTKSASVRETNSRHAPQLVQERPAYNHLTL